MTANEVKVGLGSIILSAGGAYLFLVMFVIGFCADMNYTRYYGEIPCPIPETYMAPLTMLSIGSWLVIAGLKSKNLIPARKKR
jgi:hypothetical protein